MQNDRPLHGMHQVALGAGVALGLLSGVSP